MQPTSLPFIYLTNQPTYQPTNQPASQFTQLTQPCIYPTNQPTIYRINQPFFQPTNQPTNQSVDQPASWCPMHASNYKLVNWSHSSNHSITLQCLISPMTIFWHSFLRITISLVCIGGNCWKQLRWWYCHWWHSDYWEIMYFGATCS